MLISKLKVGQIYKNYKELCATLGEPYKSSKSKEAQLREWSLLFKWERNKDKYIITEIYEFPIAYPTDQRNRSSEYSELMYPIIIHYLYEESFNYQDVRRHYPVFIKTKPDLFHLLGFAQDIYKEPNNVKKSETAIYKTVQNLCRNIINSYFTRTLENLDKTNRILNTERYYIRSIIDEYNTPLNELKERKKNYLADEIHTDIIKSNIQLLLREYGRKNLFEIFYYGQYKDFVKDLNKYLFQYDYTFSYRVIQLSIPHTREQEMLLVVQEYDILKKHFEIFGDKTEEEISEFINNSKKKINDTMLKKIVAKKEEDIKQFASHISSPDCGLAIYEALMHDNNGERNVEQFLQTYTSVWDDFINHQVKIKF